jgi:hypothetical protein
MDVPNILGALAARRALETANGILDLKNESPRYPGLVTVVCVICIGFVDLGHARHGLAPPDDQTSK